jgi:hypothetical protein
MIRRSPAITTARRTTQGLERPTSVRIGLEIVDDDPAAG